MRAQLPAPPRRPQTLAGASPGPAKQQARCLPRKRQLCVSRSSRTAAEELHALVQDMAAVAAPSSVQTLLQPSITDTVHALASGDDQKAAESYSGDAQVRVWHSVQPATGRRSGPGNQQHSRSHTHTHTHSSCPTIPEAFSRYFN